MRLAATLLIGAAAFVLTMVAAASLFPLWPWYALASRTVFGWGGGIAWVAVVMWPSIRISSWCAEAVYTGRWVGEHDAEHHIMTVVSIVGVVALAAYESLLNRLLFDRGTIATSGYIALLSAGAWLFFVSGRKIDRYWVLRWYRRRAWQGDAEAQDRIGWMYFRGECIARDVVRALAWLTIAAAQAGECQTSFASSRDYMAEQMNRADVAESKKLARALLLAIGERGAGIT